jgi:hypothetical protein
VVCNSGYYSVHQGESVEFDPIANDTGPITTIEITKSRSTARLRDGDADRRRPMTDTELEWFSLRRTPVELRWQQVRSGALGEQSP